MLRSSFDIFEQNNWGKRPMSVPPHSINGGNASRGGERSTFLEAEVDAPAAEPAAQESDEAAPDGQAATGADATSPSPAAAPAAAYKDLRNLSESPATSTSRSGTSRSEGCASVNSSRAPSRAAKHPSSRGRRPDGSLPSAPAPAATPEMPVEPSSDAMALMATSLNSLISMAQQADQRQEAMQQSQNALIQALTGYLSRQ